MEKYNIMFASHPDYSGNCKALYEYMKKKYKEMNLVWTIYDGNYQDVLKNKDIRFVLYNSEEFNLEMQKADIVFFTHDELINEKREGQIYIYLGHGCGSKKFGYMIEKDNLAKDDEIYLYKMREAIDYIICASELYKTLYSVMFNFEYDRILPLGTPRIDYVYSPNSVANLALVCDRNLNKYNKILMYLPTIRNGIGRKGDGSFTKNVLNLDEYDESELERYLEKNNYLLIIKYHPYETNKEAKSKADNIVYLDEKSLTDNGISLTEIIGGANLVIADYSSAYSDFVAMNKPVCFLLKDLESYKKNRGILFNNIEMWCPGPYIKNIKQFTYEVNKLLSDPKYYSDERKNYTRLVFGDNLKSTSKKICNYLFNENISLSPKNRKKTYDDLQNEVKIKNKIIDKQKCELKKFNNDYRNIMVKNQELESQISELLDQLNVIYNPKGWKLLEKIRGIVRK